MNFFAIVLEQLEIFAIYMLIGTAAVRAHILNRERLGVLSDLVTKILLPLLIFTNTINGTTRDQFLSSSIILVIATFQYLFLYFLSGFLVRASRLEGNRKKVYRACTTFGNCGFMGIPIVTALYPEQSGLYLAMYTVVDQLMLWTLGLELTTPVDTGKPTLPVARRLRKMVNPATVSILFGVILVLTGLKLPAVIVKALTKTGAAAPPLSMIYLGGMFSFIRVSEYVKKAEIYLMIVIRMVAAPLFVYNVLQCIPGLDLSIAVTLSVICGLPSMSSVAMLAESQHSDSDYSAGMIFITTIFSIVTLPFVCYLLK